MTSVPKLVALTALGLFLACNSATTNTAGNQDQQTATYHSAEVGWTMRLPADWDRMSKEEIEQLTGTGLNAFEDANGVDVDTSQLTPLVGFKQGPFNSFISTMEKLDSADIVGYDAFQNTLKEMLAGTFTAQGIRADTTTTSETVQGLDFDVFNITIYAPDGAVIMNSSMYSRMQKGYDFAATLNYNSDAARDTMLAVWRGSTFER